MGFLLMNWKWLGLLAILAGTNFYTWEHTHNVDSKKLADYEAQVTLAAKEQEVKTQQIVTQQQQVTQQVKEQYNADISNIHSYYAKLLRDRQNSGGKVSSVPNTPRRIDEIPSDSIPLAEQCAKTTEQLEKLKKWVNDQDQGMQ